MSLDIQKPLHDADCSFLPAKQHKRRTVNTVIIVKLLNLESRSICPGLRNTYIITMRDSSTESWLATLLKQFNKLLRPFRERERIRVECNARISKRSTSQFTCTYELKGLYRRLGITCNANSDPQVSQRQVQSDLWLTNFTAIWRTSEASTYVNQRTFV